MLNEEIQNLKKIIAEKFTIEKKRIRMKELEFIVADHDFWKNNKVDAETRIKEYGLLKAEVEEYDAISSLEEVRKFEERFITKNKYEHLPALISVFPGAGGEDASDWAEMLLKMYQGYATRRGWKISQIDSDTIEIKGEDAFNILRQEYGVHRLVRISPYDAKKLRHTAFALVEVLPLLRQIDTDNINIPEKDIKVDFTRSSGPGGQNVNKVETAVRIIHIPTGLSASSQIERSQARNRERALTILKTKLLKLMEEKQETEIESLKTRVNPEWGHQIRSYVLHPYKLVKDHRTEYETRKVDDVLEGNLDGFIEAELQL